MELCSGGTLVDLMNANVNVRWPEPFIWSAFAKVVSLVAELHARNPPLTHNDLKIENMLMATKINPMVCVCITSTNGFTTPL
ncbi:hypothetical protein KIPB_009443 [Kipferlia bialata]|uniref:non-specific serine/threonine protein kinase n=1 Tax=Kipferlia bialata TaxID=797122 RepID=A0A9K3D508_9EUKA|nr:hypothetical protein KIPB_009443 [Kipferlia bialata]|eukprot:g9443.t1